MKNLFLILFILGIAEISFAQTNTFPSSGNVGIGTTSPGQKLDVFGTIRAGVAPTYYADISYLGTTYTFGSGEVSDNVTFSIAGAAGGTAGNNFIFKTQTGNVTPVEQMRITSGGSIGIGTTSPTEKLSVNGKIRSKEVKVEIANWPDYVFKNDYELKPLPELEKFIQLNNHLPGIAPAKEIEKNGLELGEMNAILLKKIEELTLYLIQQDKEIKMLKGRRFKRR